MENDEIVKRNPPRDKKTDYAMRAAKRLATLAAKKAKVTLAEPTRTHKVVDDEEGPEAAGRSGTRLNSRTGRAEAVGRDGEVLSRTTHHVTDSYEVPKDKWPKDWDYQWNTLSIHGNADIAKDAFNHMQAQGWRAVPAERLAKQGILPATAKGSVIRSGSILEERPTSLGDEARAEDLAAARRLISDRNESLKLTGVQKSMPEGFVARNDVSGIRMQIDKSLDVQNVNRESGRYTLEK